MATVINRLITRNAGIRYSTGMEIDIDRCRLAMSGTSRWIMNRTRIEHVIQRRQDNYTCLRRYLADTPCIRIVREQLPEGVCPLFFPVKIEGVSRNDVQDRLLKAGIGTFVFGEELHPTLPIHQFRNAEILSQGILCLPVHQDLKPTDMPRMAVTLLRAIRELSNADTH
jgi:dTDP-4-amino-4,6-dideoxygalactose transaminase